MRRPVIAANWKMYKTVREAEAFVGAFLPRVAGLGQLEVLLAPPFPALAAVGRRLAGSAVALAAQNVNPEQQGAFTGEVSPLMLMELGCAYCIVGHSERRTLYGESDAFVARKTAALLEHGIRPIVCVGETLEQREQGRSAEVVKAQLAGSLAAVPSERAADVVVAYEPIWAIGTGRTATPALAQEVHALIRATLGERFGAEAERIRIQYGGSVKPDNAAALLAEKDIDGALVGGASLEPESFAQIVRAGGAA
jgi:triosephosphate isomerase